MKRLIFAAAAFALTLGFIRTSEAQTAEKAEKSLKTLKKSLAKDSRYGDEVIYWFKSVDFKSCEISYRFSRLNENSSERFAAVVADRTSPLVRNDTVLLGDLPEKSSTTQQNAARSQNTTSTLDGQVRARAKVFYNNSFPYYYYGVDRRAFFLEQVVTVVDLADIDPNSIKVETSPAGSEYVVFSALKDKTGIGKRLFGDAAEVVDVESDFLPVTGRKGADKISAALTEAVNACRE